ncbi:hypothetical protein J132_07640 [Termitomyces sp. J132]|nr:hypothetical protein J132_07640 [Termitomyces sp. J132]
MQSFNLSEGNLDGSKGLADEEEPEDLSAVIRNFLASNDCNKTCPDYRETIEKFFERIAKFLNAVHDSQIGYHDMKRLTVCFEALFALLHAIPYGRFSHINTAPLAKPLSRLVRTNHNGNISIQAQANCLFALYKQFSVPSGFLFVSTGKGSRSTTSHKTCLPCLSLEADRAMQQIDVMRQNLEDDLVGFEQGSVDEGRVSESLTVYFHTINRGSRVIVTWLANLDAGDEIGKDVLGDWSSYMIRIRKIIGSLNPSSLKGEDLLSVAYHNIPDLNGRAWSIMALPIIGYMRHTKVYPVLPDFSHYNSFVTSDLLEFWFPFLKEVDKRWISGLFARELLPLAFALNILVQNKGATVQVKDLSLSSSYDMMDILRYSAIYSSPNLSTMGLPFSLLASINCTTRGCKIRGIFDLVSIFRSSHFSGWSGEEIQTIAGPIIGEALRILKEQCDTNWSEESLLLSFSVLWKIFVWEREESDFPFSKDNMDYIVNILFRNILEKQDLVILLDSDCTDMIASLKGVCTNGHSGCGMVDDDLTSSALRIIPLFDLQSLHDAPVQSRTSTAQKNQLDMILPAIPRVPKFLEAKGYRRVDTREKDGICLRVMGWRGHQETIHMS